MSSRASDISWTGEFTDPAQERAFADNSAVQSRNAARLCVIATSATSLSFAPLDVTALPSSSLPYFLADRLLILALCLGTLMALGRFGRAGQIVAITLIQQYLFFTLNALIFNHPVLLRHGGALLPLIPISLLICLPGSFRAVAALSFFAPAISLLFWGIARPHPETPQDLFIIALIIGVAYVVGAVTRSQFGRMRREQYLHIEHGRRINQTLLEAKEAAEAGSRAKANFMAVMSHEIRTPMNGVLGMVRLVLDSELAPQEHRRLETACQCATGLLTILDDILDISKLESGRVDFESEPFALKHTVADVVTMMGARAREKGLSLTLEMEPSLPGWVSGDCARLRQILFNLIGNAVKFTEQGGVSVRVDGRSAETGLMVNIAVSDTGIGIDASQHDHIFQAFAQAEATISRRFGGTGLGLAICKKLVEGMGGTIDFDSTPGQGSCFRVGLVFTPAQPVAATPAPAAAPVSALSVLLAEDNPVNREVAKAYLGKAGHRVSTAVNGAEAVAQASGGGFDLILMDMHMPVVDGLEATRRIRALPGARGQVPVIALTANAMGADIARCRAAGMDAHIAKPMSQATLTATIAQVLAERHGHAPQAGPSFDILLMGRDDTGLGDTMTTLGHRVFSMPDDEAALAMLAARPFDLAVLTPGPAARVEAAGQALARHHPRPPILAAALAGQDDALRQAGADGMLPANATANDVADALARHLPADDGTAEDLNAILTPERAAHVRTLLMRSLQDDAAILSLGGLEAERLHRMAHRIKGSAATMRLNALAEVAAATEAAMRNSGPSPREVNEARHTLHVAIDAAILAMSSFTVASAG